MIGNRYWKDFRRKMRGFDKAKVDEIIAELSDVSQGDSAEQLEKRFGSAAALAANYRDELEIRAQERSKFSWLRNTFTIIGAVCVLLFGGCALLIYKGSSGKDEIYDYTDESAREAYWDKANWQAMITVPEEPIMIKQSRIAWYFEDRTDVILACKPVAQNSVLSEATFRQSECVVRSPIERLSFDVEQSSVTFMQPTSDIEIKSFQSAIRLDNRNRVLNTDIQSRHKSDVVELKSTATPSYTVSLNVSKSRVGVLAR